MLKAYFLPSLRRREGGLPRRLAPLSCSDIDFEVGSCPHFPQHHSSAELSTGHWPTIAQAILPCCTVGLSGFIYRYTGKANYLELNLSIHLFLLEWNCIVD